MEGNVRLVSHDPAVVRRTGDVEQIPLPELDGGSVWERGRRRPSQHQSHMLDGASVAPDRRADMDRPLPARLVSCPADRDVAEPDDLESAVRHLPNFIGILKSFENDRRLHGNLRSGACLPNDAALPPSPSLPMFTPRSTTSCSSR
jgi:hypothetical protein